MSLTAVSLTFRAYCLQTSRLQLYVSITLSWLIASAIGASIWRTLDTWQIFGTQIIHQFTAVLFSQILVMCYFIFVYAILCGILTIFIVCYFQIVDIICFCFIVGVLYLFVVNALFFLTCCRVLFQHHQCRLMAYMTIRYDC